MGVFDVRPDGPTLHERPRGLDRDRHGARRCRWYGFGV